jgi:N-acetylmuramoyl-L-alanine amidase
MQLRLLVFCIAVAAAALLELLPHTRHNSTMINNTAVAREEIEFDYSKREGTSKLLPVITSMPANPKSRLPVVVIDPGHGTRDVNGNITGQGASGQFNGREVAEEGLTLDYSMWLMAELRLLGVPCYATRTYDDPWFDVDYSGHDQQENNKRRAEFAAAHDAALFVRVHFDGSAEKSSSGFSIWYNDMSRHDKDGTIKKESMEAADAVRLRLAEVMQIPDLGLMRFERPIYGFVHASQPSILLELAFLSSETDTAYVLREDTLRSVSQATALGIRDYLDARAR